MRLLLFVFIVLISSLKATAQMSLDMVMFNVASGKNVTLQNEFSEVKGLVIVFMSNECPFSIYYISRLKKIEKEYTNRGIGVVFVNSFLSVDESNSAMEIFAKENGFTYYLSDKSLQLKNQLKARKSPEVFLLKRSGNQFIRFYNGPIDNNAQVEEDVKDHYLQLNIENLLNKKPAIKSKSPVMGCVIH